MQRKCLQRRMQKDIKSIETKDAEVASHKKWLYLETYLESLRKYFEHI